MDGIDIGESDVPGFQFELRETWNTFIDPDVLRYHSWPDSTNAALGLPPGLAVGEEVDENSYFSCGHFAITSADDTEGGADADILAFHQRDHFDRSSPMIIDPSQLTSLTDIIAGVGLPAGVPQSDPAHATASRRLEMAPIGDAELDTDVPAYAQPDGDVDASKNGDGHGTTVFVQDLPCKVGAQRMMVELKLLGFDGCYSFINFPTKSKNGKQVFLGYGFINFVSYEIAARFMHAFDGYRFGDVNSEKRARVSLAHVQGQPANKRRLCSSRKKNAFLQDPQGLKAPACPEVDI
eukprot:TRINITY_DN17330_c0_g2_i1.p1 TRINITY_DN17330_c0_g2~~TRINITY_DN17330_c0_g2_i1.p1  ORF type:complete len:294 (-),score=56.72 TRINITY_DN17330_c0_g2_i1:101-982(-)